MLKVWPILLRNSIRRLSDSSNSAFSKPNFKFQRSLTRDEDEDDEIFGQQASEARTGQKYQNRRQNKPNRFAELDDEDDFTALDLEDRPQRQQNFRNRNDFRKPFRDDNPFRRSNKPYQNKVQEEKRPCSVEVQGEILYGNHPVNIALEARKRDVHHIYFRDRQGPGEKMQSAILQKAEQLGIPSKKISQYDITQLCGKDVIHQDMCADVGKLNVPQVSGDVIDSRFNLLLAGIHDPMNMGAIFRSSMYFGVNTVFLPRVSSCKLSPVVSKASSGALEILNLQAIDEISDFVSDRKQSGWKIVGTGVTNVPESVPVMDISQFQMGTEPLLVIVGNEGIGITSEVFSLCDLVLTITPQYNIPASLDCLNVSAATAILLHNLAKQIK